MEEERWKRMKVPLYNGRAGIELVLFIATAFLDLGFECSQRTTPRANIARGARPAPFSNQLPKLFLTSPTTF